MNMEAIKSLRICPGCGAANPTNATADGEWFTCACGYESVPTLPTIGELLDMPPVNNERGETWSAVDLGAFLRTLFTALATSDQPKGE